MLNENYQSIHIVSDYALTKEDIRQLKKLFQLPVKSSNTVLGGRSTVLRINLAGIGPVVIKYYTRGGIVNYFVKSHYIRWRELCCQQEYNNLLRIRSLGVRAPEPIAYAYKGGPIYKAWLITREIPNQKLLSELQPEQIDVFDYIMKDLISQLTLLIENSIYHIDLHPGNVLVDQENKTYLVDFDKAYTFAGSKQKLRKKYRHRWERSVHKHNLPKILTKWFSTAI